MEIKKKSVDNRTNKIKNENIGKQRRSREKDYGFKNVIKRSEKN